MNHYLTREYYHLIVQWRSLNPGENSTCMIRIGTGLDDEASFSLLTPLNEKANEEGWFRCGGYSNAYESRTFRLPNEISCESCTVQLIWNSSGELHYQCADITVMNEKVPLCMGKCHNGGACVNGKCVCRERYYGDFCEYKRIFLYF